jgi:hypothetical protein
MIFFSIATESWPATVTLALPWLGSESAKDAMAAPWSYVAEHLHPGHDFNIDGLALASISIYTDIEVKTF